MVKLWTEAGPAFGSEKIYVSLIVIPLYGMNSSGSYWRSKLSDTRNSMDYRSTESESGVWVNR